VGMALSAIATKPSDTQTILVGTGDLSNLGPAGALHGAGIWRTTNGGVNWTNVKLLKDTGDYVFRIVWSTSSPNTAHAATQKGYFRSTDGGANWFQLTTTQTTDVVVDPLDNSRVFLAVPRSGIMRCTDSGASCQLKLAKPNFGWTTMSIAASTPRIVYIAADESGTPNGGLALYKTINSGDSWSPIQLGGFSFNNCYRDVAIGTNTDGSVVIAGCDSLIRSSLAGSIGTWTDISNINTHGDFHVIKFSDATTVLIGSDGGYHYSTDSGVTWASNSNVIPINNLMAFDVGLNDPTVFFGGSWDTGPYRSTDAGATWQGSIFETMEGDQVEMLVDPGDANRAWASDRSRNRYRMTGGGWVRIPTGPGSSSGLPDPEGWVKFQHDQVPGVFLYTQSGKGIYKSTDFGVTWSKYPSALTADFPINVADFSAGRYKNATAESVIYARLNSPGPTKLVVLDKERSSNFWFDVTTAPGLPQPTIPWIRFAVSGRVTDQAYLLSSNRIFRTTNRGQSWTEVTGNLPSGVSLSDLVEHPNDANVLYASTLGGAGVYKTTNAGPSSNWRTWSNGIPAGGNNFMQLKFKNYPSGPVVFGGAWGTGIWRREANGDDP